MKRILQLCMFILLSLTAKGNNVQVSDVKFADQNIGIGEVSIQFNISWDNSWRVSTAPNNWDAVWLFAKYKSVDGTWHHATLSQNNNSTGSQGSGAILSVRSDNVGAYFHRSGDGTGTFSSTDVKLRWDYEANGIGCNLGKFITEVKVFAIEMVYIPQGPFYVGSGGDETGCFYSFDDNNPYHIASESAITVGNINNALAYTPDADFRGDNNGPIPATFPKGYNAFYCMKYEVTQEQYADFLNTLTASQINNRYMNKYGQKRNYIKLINNVYGCDANNNNILNESDDGQNIACNWMSWADGCAFSDWAGLRPMTELEYEKACRGPLQPVANEYAWGTTAITPPGNINSIISINQASEASNNPGANCNVYSNGAEIGPMRVGSFNGVGRVGSGSSYYGIRDLSGDLWEQCVSVGNTTGRSFNGNMGDGILSNNGVADIPTLPGINAIGSGYRGGSWHWYVSDYARYSKISDRYFAARAYSQPSWFSGFRCVSSAAPESTPVGCINGEITIGTQTWMCQNLNVSTYRNGDPIPQVTDSMQWRTLTTGAWCYYGNNPDSGAVYGKLYNWFAVNDPRGLAPEGWHIPTHQEWITLENYLGGSSVAGGKLKSTGTKEDCTGLWLSPNTGATNESGFNALPGGYRGHNGRFRENWIFGIFWSTTPVQANEIGWVRILRYNTMESPPVNLINDPSRFMLGASVRCIKDN